MFYTTGTLRHYRAERLIAVSDLILDIGNTFERRAQQRHDC